MVFAFASTVHWWIRATAARYGGCAAKTSTAATASGCCWNSNEQYRMRFHMLESLIVRRAMITRAYWRTPCRNDRHNIKRSALNARRTTRARRRRSAATDVGGNDSHVCSSDAIRCALIHLVFTRLTDGLRSVNTWITSLR